VFLDVNATMKNVTQEHNSTKVIEGEAECWSCSAVLAVSEHFCSTCGKVQPVRPMTHFEFFGLRKKLNLNEQQLQKEFYALSRKLHPDVYARSTANEQDWSLQKTSQLNDAYRTLKDPIARTQYLLSLEGIQLEEQSRSATDAARQSGEEKKQVVPPALLEEVFELNMQLQELKTGERDPATIAQLESAKENFQQKLNESTDELKQYWNEWDSAKDQVAEKKAMDQMVALLNRRSYIRNLVRDVNAALSEAA
jgi:molecular chaperone HscB